jgi:putative selenoprotein
VSALRARWRRVGYWVREFLGENDYVRYLDDWAARHGDAPRAGAITAP